MAYYHGTPGMMGRGEGDQDFFSNSYMWSARNKLGQGATGQVFVGYDKRSGDRVAVKMFTNQGEYRAMQAEMQTIKALKIHPNIVHFLEVGEIEKQRNYYIIAMELCNGGSLYEVIDSPNNAFGLDEYQFKCVMFDVASGMRHLREQGFVHRDIKPGNIMRSIKPDGSYVFKLADFGTARQLGPDEHFTSLHGTEEYLYPAMYERALIDYRSKEEFQDRVDLWSLGATFFHLATGRLPFRPFKKRQDRATMYKIISEKKSGVILGWQQERDGQIYYNNKIPSDAVISLGLRDIVTPILAGVLDSFDRMWGFDKFFRSIDIIRKKMVIHVFCVSCCTCHMVYIDDMRDADVIPHLKDLIAKQSNLDAKHMELYFENILYGTEPVKAKNLPLTTPDAPLTVFGGPPQKPDKLATPVLTQPPPMPPDVSVVDDLRYAKDCTKVIWAIYRAAEIMNRYFHLMNQAALCLRETLHGDYVKWCRKYDEVQLRYNSLIEISISQISALESDVEFLKAVNSFCNNAFDGDIKDLQIHLEDKETHLREIKDQSYSLHEQTKDFHATVDAICHASSWDTNFHSDIFTESIKTVMTYVEKVEEIFKEFQEQKKSKGSPQSACDKKAHEYNKRTIKDRLEKADKKLQDMRIGRAEVYARLYTFLEKCTPVREDLKNLMLSLEVCSKDTIEDTKRLQKWLPIHQQKMQNLLKKLSSNWNGGREGGGGMGSSNQSQFGSIYSLLQRANESRKGLAQSAKDQTELLSNYMKK